MNKIFATFAILTVASAYETAAFAKAPDCDQLFAGFNDQESRRSVTRKVPGPVAEFMPTEYVVMSLFEPENFHFGIFQTIIENLPTPTKVLILTPDYTGKGSLQKKRYSKEDIERLLPKDSQQRERVEFLRVKVPASEYGQDHGNWTRDFLSNVAFAKDGTPLIINMTYGRERADVTDDHYIQFLVDFYKKRTHREPQVVDVPFFYEGGNLATNGQGLVYVSERFFQNNKRAGNPIEIREAQAWFKRLFGSQVKLTVLPSVPYEDTGHLDMYVKFLDAKRAIVSSSPNAGGPYLDEIANTLTADGIEVIRHPLAFPVKRKKRPQGDGMGGSSEDSQAFRSYTNAQIVGGTVFVPQFANPFNGLKRQDQGAIELYEKLDFKAIGVDGSVSIEFGGMVHCLIQTIPQPELFGVGTRLRR